MEILKAYWKVEPSIDIKGKSEEEIEALIHNKLMDITMNPSDYIGFDEVGQTAIIKDN